MPEAHGQELTVNDLNTETASVQDQVAEEIRALLARRRISARKVSMDLGWSPAYLSRRLTSQTSFSIADLDVLARYLGVSILTFMPDMRFTWNLELAA